MQYDPEPTFHCGDPGQMGIREKSADEIRSEWKMATVVEDFLKWIRCKG